MRCVFVVIFIQRGINGLELRLDEIALVIYQFNIDLTCKIARRCQEKLLERNKLETSKRVVNLLTSSAVLWGRLVLTR